MQETFSFYNNTVTGLSIYILAWDELLSVAGILFPLSRKEREEIKGKIHLLITLITRLFMWLCWSCLGSSHPSSPQLSTSRFCFHCSLEKDFWNLFFLRVSFSSNFVSEAFEDKLKRAKQQQQWNNLRDYKGCRGRHHRASTTASSAPAFIFVCGSAVKT